MDSLEPKQLLSVLHTELAHIKAFQSLQYTPGNLCYLVPLNENKIQQKGSVLLELMILPIILAAVLKT